MTDIAALLPLAGRPFVKMTGTGNDFVIMDAREAPVPPALMPLLARAVCQRRRSVGADGLIVLGPSQRVDPSLGKIDFRWDFYNADGSSAEMCGNGGRCAARFAHDRGLAGPAMAFDTLAGPIRAWVNQDGSVKLEMTRPHGFYQDVSLEAGGQRVCVDGVNTGVPHAVLAVGDLAAAPVVKLGRALRYHAHFAPAGSNVNFTRVHDGELWVRTYERGVEDETLACGTGSVASALVAARRGLLAPPITVRVRSGERLKVYCDPAAPDFGQVCLEGAASYVYRGTLHAEAFAWLATAD